MAQILKRMKRHHKTPRIIIGKTFSDINCSNVFLDQSPKAIEIREKNKQMEPNQTYKLLHSKGNQKQNGKKKNLQTRRNICKGWNLKGFNLTDHKTQQ